MATAIATMPPVLDLAARQGPPAGRLVLGRLCRRRHHAADRRRVLVRGHRPPRRPARARRRRGQRQRLARRRAPLVRRGRHRLCAGPARARARACRCRSAANRLPRRRCRSPAVRGWQLRRRAVDLRRHVHPRPGARGGRAPAGLPARRQIGLANWTPTASSASSSRRSAATCRRPPAPAPRRSGAPASAWPSCSGRRLPDPASPATSCCATARRSTGSTSSAPTTGPC